MYVVVCDSTHAIEICLLPTEIMADICVTLGKLQIVLVDRDMATFMEAFLMGKM